MKKTILLSALLASASAFAATTGTLTVSNDTETNFKKSFETGLKGTKTTPKVVLDMKVKDTGFSFGGEFLIKEMKPLEKIIGTPEGNAWAKYELPEIKGVKSYVKGTFDHEQNLTGEVDLSYNYE